MTEFQKVVHRVTRGIPRGKVLTYGEVARMLGNKNLARAVGNTLNKNYDRSIPCHRVVCRDGRVGGFNRGMTRKIKLLKGEGVKIKNSRIMLSPFIKEGSEYL